MGCKNGRMTVRTARAALDATARDEAGRRKVEQLLRPAMADSVRAAFDVVGSSEDAEAVAQATDVLRRLGLNPATDLREHSDDEFIALIHRAASTLH